MRFKAEQTEHQQAFLDTVHAQLNTYTHAKKGIGPGGYAKLLADATYKENSPDGPDESKTGSVVVLLNKFEKKNKFKEENKAWYVKPLSPRARTHTHTHTHTHTRS